MVLAQLCKIGQMAVPTCLVARGGAVECMFALGAGAEAFTVVWAFRIRRPTATQSQVLDISCDFACTTDEVADDVLLQRV
jgi:hypothetical protein